MIIEQLIDEFITKHVFPQFREWSHPRFPNDRYFIIGDDEYPIAMISPFDEDLVIHPQKWGIVQGMFSLTEDETVVVIKRWLNMYIPLLSFDRINLMKYP
jgi:hypothetical protein